MVRRPVSRQTGRNNEQGTPDGLQRWRYRHHHNDHGAGAEGAPCRRLGCADERVSDVSQLCAELRLCCDLLEQPPPSFFAARRVNGTILWANIHLLFWLSLLPFATGWM